MTNLTSHDEVAGASPRGDATGDDVATTALATVREVTGEIVRLVRTAATQATDGWSLVPLVRSLLPDLERVVEERTVLGRDARALRAKVGELDERVHELEALLAAREAGWNAERAAFEDDVARERERAAHARQIVEQLEASRAAAAAELSRTRATLVHAEHELLAVQHEHQLSQAHLEKLCAAHDDMVEEQAQLVAKLHDANERDARLRLRITGLEQRVQAGRDEATVAIEPPAKAIDAVVQAATASLTTELSRAEERMRVLRDELTMAKAAAGAATVRAETLAAEVHTTDQERAAAVAELESLRTTVAASTPRAHVALEPAQGVVSAAPVPTVAEQLAEPSLETGAAVPDEDPSEPIAGTKTLGEHAVLARGPIAVLDTFDAWDDTGVADVHRVGPAPEALDRLRELAPACCVVNLGAPGALEATAALRRAAMTVPFWGFAMAPDGTTLALGRFDVIARPVDPERVRAQIACLTPSGGNVIMVGSDSATLMPIREGLLQLGLSVRTAWNREQAAELADAVEPDLVTIDLGTTSAGAAELIVELSRREKPPTIVFVPGAPEYVEVLAASVGAHGVPIDRAGIVGAAAAKR